MGGFDSHLGLHMVILDKTDVCNIEPPRGKRDPRIANIIVLHRIKGCGNNAEEIARWFYDHPDEGKTGRRMPYHFVVLPDGTVEQAVKLRFEAPGALRLNKNGIQLAVLGDFRKETPTSEQLNAVQELCSLIVRWNNASITGHTDTPGASSNQNKLCPGKHLSASWVNVHVKEYLSNEAKTILLKQGILL